MKVTAKFKGSTEMLTWYVTGKLHDFEVIKKETIKIDPGILQKSVIKAEKPA
jgi:hypothetical protein